MEPDLAAFLARHTSRAEETEVWGASPLRIVSYLAGELPPPGYITSVRGLVFRDDAFLVTHNRDGTHGLPGGRREAGETPEQTIARELMEEAGCNPGEATPIGFVHLCRLTPVPPDHPYPAPDFCWLIYAANAISIDQSHTVQDDYEEGAELVPVLDVSALRLEPPAEQFLYAALAAREVLNRHGRG